MIARHRFPRTLSGKKKVSVAQVGLGEIGRACCRLAAERPEIDFVGAADIDPALRGRELGSLLGIELPAGMRVFGTIGDLLRDACPDVVVHTTGSRIAAVAGQLEEIAAAGVSCVTSSEELLLPDYRDPAAADRLDETARSCGAALVGTGVNPGFVLDLLPIVMSGACRRVDAIRAGRTVDLATRRPALRKKAGVGMTAAEFRRLAAAGKMGHVGLIESAALVCRVLGWNEKKLRESIEPIVADGELKVGEATVGSGLVRGNRHAVRLEEDGKEILLLDLRMILGDSGASDRIEIQGEPDLEVKIPGGVAGDTATAAILLNTVPLIAAAPAGLHTILDLPAVRISS